MKSARSFACSIVARASSSASSARRICPPARPKASACPRSGSRASRREMKALSDSGQLSGVVTMVAKDGKVVHFEASGKRDVASGAPMKKDTIFRIYSMTKPITGVAMMMLFEEGKWQLNDPVVEAHSGVREPQGREGRIRPRARLRKSRPIIR